MNYSGVLFSQNLEERKNIPGFYGPRPTSCRNKVFGNARHNLPLPVHCDALLIAPLPINTTAKIQNAIRHTTAFMIIVINDENEAFLGVLKIFKKILKLNSTLSLSVS